MSALGDDPRGMQTLAGFTKLASVIDFVPNRCFVFPTSTIGDGFRQLIGLEVEDIIGPAQGFPIRPSGGRALVQVVEALTTRLLRRKALPLDKGRSPAPISGACGTAIGALVQATWKSSQSAPRDPGSIWPDDRACHSDDSVRRSSIRSEWPVGSSICVGSTKSRL